MKLLEMNADQFGELLSKLDACGHAIEWAEGKTAKEVIDTCYRGDWLLWLFKRVSNDRKILTLAKANSANTVRHLMKDERSKTAVDVAIKYGEGNATKEELAAAYAAAYAAAAAAYADAADAADAAADAADADAADAAAYAADAAAYAAYATDAADADAYAAAYAAAAAAYAAAAAAYAARTKNRLLTANLCRQYLKFAEVEIED